MKSKGKKNTSGGDLDVTQWQHRASNDRCGHYEPDRNKMSDGNRHERLPYGSGTLLLHSKSDRKKPAHSWIDAMVGPEKKQRSPGP